MKFAMTGHKGLIGNSLLEKLEKEGHKPVLLVDKRNGDDILNISEISLYDKADIMIHLASFCKINQTIEHPELAFKNNVLGTYKILEFCRSQKIPKIAFTSSSRVLEPEKNPYTASKIYGEELCKGYQQSYGINYVIIRPSTVYGPFDDLTHRLIDIWIRNAMKNEPLEVFGNRGKTLDFTYIDDFVSGFLLTINEENKEFDIGSGKATRLEYVAELIKRETESKSQIVYKEAETAQPQHIELDITEMKKIGYKPKVSIEEGIKRTVQGYLENIKP